MNVLLIVILILLGIPLLFYIINNSSTPDEFRKRESQLEKWKERFPSSTEEEIRTFLLQFIYGFAYFEKYVFSFSPDDIVFQIYRKMYPEGSLGDHLELESWAEFIEDEYNIDFDEIWNTDLTFGKLFGFIISSKLDDKNEACYNLSVGDE